jgi:hypothetical protein
MGCGYPVVGYNYRVPTVAQFTMPPLLLIPNYAIGTLHFQKEARIETNREWQHHIRYTWLSAFRLECSSDMWFTISAIWYGEDHLQSRESLASFHCNPLA